MGNLTTEFGGKGEGQLIRSQDWNGLIEAIDTKLTTLDDKVQTGLADLSTRVDSLNETVSQLRQELTTFRNAVEPITRSYYRLTMKTTRHHYAIGEVGEIVARVSDLHGNPLDLADAASRPWVDFVAAWGQLKPVDGFPSLGGSGDRAISVQVNQQGEARVQVRAEHADGVPEEVEIGMVESLTTVSSGDKTIAEVILEANTPLEASNRGAFSLIAAEYDRIDVPHVRHYLDSYYLWQPPVIDNRWWPPRPQGWRDYRSTILAFVKNDADPSTADPSRGVSSIQVVFRDWLGPFISLEYFNNNDKLINLTADQLASGLLSVDDLNLALTSVSSIVAQSVAGKGLLARQRGFRVINAALDQLQLADPPGYLPILRETVKDAVAMQEAMELSQLTVTGSDQVAVDVLTNTALRSGADVASLEQEFSELQEGFTGVSEELQTVNQQVATFGSSLTEFSTRTGVLEGRITAINGRYEGLSSSYDNLKLRTDEFAGQVAELDSTVGNLNLNAQSFVTRQDFDRHESSINQLTNLTNNFNAQANTIAAQFSDVDSKVQLLTGLDATKVNAELQRINDVVFRVETLERGNT
jgi:uncharacterized protein YoxC